MIALPRHNDSTIEVRSASGIVAIIKKVAGGVYVMKTRYTTHMRWGNAKEIRQDIKYFITNGVLPRSDSATCASW